MADVVKRVLRKAAENAEKFKTTEVDKDLELDLDLGNLLADDKNPILESAYRKNKEQYLKELTRDNTQLLINKIWEVPSERLEDVIVIKVPEPLFHLPRAKPLPKIKPPTKWEEFSRSKGIQNRKKDNLVWDEHTKQWHPRHGYRRAPDGDEEWVMEYKKNDDPFQDLFEKKKDNKKENVAKNELQRLRNIARSKNKKVPGVGLVPIETQTVDSLSKAAILAKSSTASFGKFTENLPREKSARKTGVKRKFDPMVGDSKEERKRSLAILDRIKSKESKLNLQKAENSHTQGEEVMQAEKNIMGKKNKKGNTKGKSASTTKKSRQGKVGKMTGRKGGKMMSKKDKR